MRLGRPSPKSRSVGSDVVTHANASERLIVITRLDKDRRPRLTFSDRQLTLHSRTRMTDNDVQ